VFDCETTGTDRTRDQVVELCVQVGLGDEARDVKTWRIKPDVPIHPGAQAVHGISIEDLADCPRFAAIADDVTRMFEGADVVVGYNIAFDIDMLQAEYARIGRPLLELANKQIIDAFKLWQVCEPRSLQHAHQRFVGNEFASAHSASADVVVTGRVLSGMLRHFSLDGQDWSQLATVCDPEGRLRDLVARTASWVGPSHHLRWEAEVIVVNFGKHANTPLHELANGPERSFLRWVLDRPAGRDFPPHVNELCRAALEQSPEELLAWARTRYGVAAPTSRPAFAAAESAHSRSK
jgi:DNA polymerase-3 subunit epsilon